MKVKLLGIAFLVITITSCRQEIVIFDHNIRIEKIENNTIELCSNEQANIKLIVDTAVVVDLYGDFLRYEMDTLVKESYCKELTLSNSNFRDLNPYMKLNFKKELIQELIIITYKSDSNGDVVTSQKMIPLNSLDIINFFKDSYSVLKITGFKTENDTKYITNGLILVLSH